MTIQQALSQLFALVPSNVDLRSPEEVAVYAYASVTKLADYDNIGHALSMAKGACALVGLRLMSTDASALVGAAQRGAMSRILNQAEKHFETKRIADSINVSTDAELQVALDGLKGLRVPEAAPATEALYTVCKQVSRLRLEALEKIKKTAAYEPGDTGESLFAQGQENAYNKVLLLIEPHMPPVAPKPEAAPDAPERRRYMLAVRCPDGTVARETFWLSGEEKDEIKRKLADRLDLFRFHDSPANRPSIEEVDKRYGADAALGWLDARMNPKTEAENSGDDLASVAFDGVDRG